MSLTRQARAAEGNWIMRTLLPLILLLSSVAPVVAGDPASKEAVRTAIEKGLKRIEQGAASYPKHRQCFSCHHQAMSIFSTVAAKDRRFTVDEVLLQKQIEFSLKSFAKKDKIVKGEGVGGASATVTYALQTFATVDHPRDETIAALVEYLLVRQRRDGAWPQVSNRPPTEAGIFTNNALAMAVLRKYRPSGQADKELAQRVDNAVSRGREWLLDNEPSTTEDKVFRLRGLVWGECSAKEIKAAQDLLLNEQRPDGSWAQLADLSGDAYATATALVALRHAGLPADHPVYKKGVDYLLATQKEGAWVVETRSRPIQIFFDNGDAGGSSQFISFTATNWAVMALLETIPLQSARASTSAGTN